MVTNNSWNSQNPAQVAVGGTGVQTLTSHGILMGNATGVVNATAEPSDGQLLIGKTGNFPVLASLSAGTNISITPGAGTISIAATNSSSGLTWQAKGASGALVNGEGFMCNAGLALSFSLPAAAAVGTEIAVGLAGSTSWTITQGLGQSIQFGNTSTTPGAGGSLASTSVGDIVHLVCITADTKWVVVYSVGNITVV